MNNTEQRILESAIRQFIRFGFKKTSLDDIVQDIHISKGTIYIYFKNKEELFKRVAESERQRMHDQLTSQIALETDAFQKLVLYVTKKIQHLRLYYEKRGSSIAVFKELKEAYETLGADRSDELSILLNILIEGQKQQIFQLDHQEQTAKLLLLTIQSHEIRWANMRSEQAETEIKALFELLFKGMKST